MGLATIEDTFNRMAKALERLADATEATQKAMMSFRKDDVSKGASLQLSGAGASAVVHQQKPAATPPDAAEMIQYETINKAICSYADRFGQEAAKSVLKRFGATIIKDLKANPSRYAEVLEATKVGP
jgi:hypothetical protein